MSAPRLSIIIPAYREAHIIGQNLNRVSEFLRTTSLDSTTEVIVVATRAGDGTAAIARKHIGDFTSLKVVEPEEAAGKGRDVRAGFLAATGTYQLFMDADLATPLKYIPLLVDKLENGHDVIIGVRTLNTIHHGLRSFISLFGNTLIRTLLGMAIKDTQCGFKGFRHDAAQLVFARQTIQGWGFDMELLMIARIHGLRVGQLAIPDWYDPRENGEMAHEKRVGIGAALSVFRELLVIKLRSMQGKYR